MRVKLDKELDYTRELLLVMNNMCIVTQAQLN